MLQNVEYRSVLKAVVLHALRVTLYWGGAFISICSAFMLAGGLVWGEGGLVLPVLGFVGGALIATLAQKYIAPQATDHGDKFITTGFAKLFVANTIKFPVTMLGSVLATIGTFAFFAALFAEQYGYALLAFVAMVAGAALQSLLTSDN